MRRSALALAATAVATALAVGVAWGGFNIDCSDGGRCDGTPDRDVMTGGPLSDQIHALGGSDDATGEGADDSIFGGRGNDVLFGGARADLVRGGPGDDAQSGSTVRAPRGPAPPPGSFPGLFGDGGNDRLYGDGGDDHLEGDAGRDKMFGGRGRDLLDAQSNDDGGTRDVLDCGPGFDRFIARRVDEVARNCERRREPFPEPMRTGG